MPIPRDLEHSRRRAHHRERCLLALARARIATIGELAADTGIRPARIRGILRGDGREYAYDLSLLAQGAAAPTPLPSADAFTITTLGAREASRLMRARGEG